MSTFAEICASRKFCAACRGPAGAKGRAYHGITEQTPCPLQLSVGATPQEVWAALKAERDVKPVQITIRSATRSAPAAKPLPKPLPLPLPRDQWPLAVRVLARLAKPGEVGVGDTVHSQTLVGGKDVVGWMIAVSRIPCGCENRRRWLNARFPYAAAG